MLLQNVYAEIKYVILLFIYFLLFLQLSTESAGTPNCLLLVSLIHQLVLRATFIRMATTTYCTVMGLSARIEAVTHAPHRVHIATCVCTAASPAATIEDPTIVMTHQ